MMAKFPKSSQGSVRVGSRQKTLQHLKHDDTPAQESSLTAATRSTRTEVAAEAISCLR
jgi:hypothetical protein